jgi:hypothetical protein
MKNPRLHRKRLPSKQSHRSMKNPRLGKPPNRYPQPRLLLKPGFLPAHATSPDR